MRHGMDILDGTIWHQQSMLRDKIFPILRRAPPDGLFHEGHVLRMNPLESKCHGRLRSLVVLEDSKCFPSDQTISPVEILQPKLPV